MYIIHYIIYTIHYTQYTVYTFKQYVFSVLFSRLGRSMDYQQ